MHDSVAALPFWSSKGKPTKLHVHQQPSHPRTWKDYLVENHTQVFWIFLSLPNESLLFAVHVLGNYSSIFTFNRISNASTGQLHQILFHPLPLSSAPPSNSAPIPAPTSHSDPTPDPPSMHTPNPTIWSYTPDQDLQSVFPLHPQSYLKFNMEQSVFCKQLEGLWGLCCIVLKSFVVQLPTLLTAGPSRPRFQSPTFLKSFLSTTRFAKIQSITWERHSSNNNGACPVESMRLGH